MTAATTILRRLLDRVDATGDGEVRSDEVATWPDGVRDYFVGCGVLERSDNATGIVCTGCHERCFVTPEPRAKPGSQHPVFLHLCEMDPDIGYVEFAPDDLLQWRLSAAGVARAIAADLGAGPVEELLHGRLWDLGETRIDKKRRRVLLAWGLRQRDAESVLEEIEKHFVAGSTVVLALSSPADRTALEPGWVADLGHRLSVQNGRIQFARDDLGPRVGRAKAAPSVRPFLLAQGIDWEGITIRFYEPDDDGLPERAQIVVGQQMEWRTFAEMGMADNRRVPAGPAQSWSHLVLLAKNGGELGWGDSNASDQARTLMHTISAALKEVFRIESSPFHDYKKLRCWKARPNLVYVRTGT